jgi:chromosome segregation ATPase
MINRDQQILKNEQEIVYLKHTIDINILEIEQKTAIIQELEQILAQRKAEYKQLKEEIKILEAQIEELHALLKQKEGEYETLEDVLRDKNQIIEGLEKAIVEKAPEAKPLESKKKSDKYKAVKGDIVDELLAQYINSMEFYLPIRRLGDGYYLFGTKKIYAKVLNNQLVVRVGGGYMNF